MKNKLTILLLIISMFLYGCGNEKATINEQEDTTKETSNITPLTIYTTIFPLYDFAMKIGGEHVKVENVYPPNVDAHSYEPTAKTMTHIASSDALIYSGAGIEGFVEAASEVLEKEKVMLVKAADGIELLAHGEHAETEDEHAHDDEHSHDEKAHKDEHDHEHSDEEHKDEHAHDHSDEEHTDEHANEEGHQDHNHGDTDPHVWLDPMYAIKMAENIKNALVELKPEAKDEFEQNFLTVKAELEKLDTEFSSVINEAAHKKILVAHAAYGYWEARYGIEQIAVTGLSPTQEPSQKQLTKIIETAKANNLTYIIFEQNVTSKISDVVKNEIGADVLYLNNLESISEDDVKNNEDYFSLMRKNIETLRTALN
ncbi:zinc ABC transporter substrate-binding protein [Bacillus luteolus]|uniref:Zinc ABC transporter substrate-binding protein n=1 Tax=Litchfieldia luteola TaxID=682179 RepID=A0ABR9QGL3_9BACI|nr:zinc ABC transporter substrate-binding protein [Cytobacillus luteolus]MBE4907576.1 zinc ABC transporter substrate-binding protein [Cytobacillus luteolus]MBP1944350.1 zinc transport system substrate-binding protein [Cytobacillus luteolus]